MFETSDAREDTICCRANKTQEDCNTDDAAIDHDLLLASGIVKLPWFELIECRERVAHCLAAGVVISPWRGFPSLSKVAKSDSVGLVEGEKGICTNVVAVGVEQIASGRLPWEFPRVFVNRQKVIVATDDKILVTICA